MDSISLLAKELLNQDLTHVFIGGIHGVGKTTICKDCFIPLTYHWVTASSLINAYGAETDRNKRVSNIKKNQEILIEQFSIEKKIYKRLILDGHYCLLNKNNQIEQIALDVFERMEFTNLILLKSDSENIVKRLSMRDTKQWDINFINQFQCQEERHAQYVSRELSIQLQTVIV